MKNEHPFIQDCKRQAKQLKKEKGISHCKALHIVAVSYGYKSFNSIIDEVKNGKKKQIQGQ